MILPHHQEFRYRRLLFWGMSAAALAFAALVSGGTPAQLGLAVLGASALALVHYSYTLWITRSDARFQDIHPRKIRTTNLLCFYLPLVAACLVVVAAPLLIRSPWLDSTRDRLLFLLSIPYLLAGAAGAHRGMRPERFGRRGSADRREPS